MIHSSINHQDTVEIVQEQTLLRIIQARKAELNLRAWSNENRDYLESTLLESGAILFRGFAMSRPEHLEELVSSLTPGMLNYIEGSSPRVRLTDKVYTSTEYPPEYDIAQHNELPMLTSGQASSFFSA